jgi:hypothetical protein
MLSTIIIAAALLTTLAAGLALANPDPTAPACDAATGPARAGDECSGVDPLDLYQEDPIDELNRVTPNQRAICVGAVQLGVGLGCLAATSACAGTTAITVGGTAYPCALVLAAACAGLPASGAVYIDRFCSR